MPDLVPGAVLDLAPVLTLGLALLPVLTLGLALLPESTLAPTLVPALALALSALVPALALGLSALVPVLTLRLTPSLVPESTLALTLVLGRGEEAGFQIRIHIGDQSGCDTRTLWCAKGAISILSLGFDCELTLTPTNVPVHIDVSAKIYSGPVGIKGSAA